MDKTVSFDFKPFFRLILVTIPFFITCIIHNMFVGPVLVEKGKLTQYCIWSLMLFALFSISMILIFPAHRSNHFPPIDRNAIEMNQPMPPRQLPPPQALHQEPPQAIPQAPQAPQAPLAPPKIDNHGPRPMSPSLLMILIGLLMLMADLGYLFYMKGIREKRNFEELERENLKYRLEYLRFQINPHFFMNTLNNIHALVDIDSEKAKESIVELSKLMRHVLYNNSSQIVPLSVELDFLGHFISLMKLRLSNQVLINYYAPEDVHDAEVPTLIFTTLVENAFKHGVSYNSDCFINIQTTIENDKIIFKCSNKIIKEPVSVTEEKGIGLDNVQKRLELIYKNNFILSNSKVNGIFETLLVIPTHQHIINNE